MKKPTYIVRYWLTYNNTMSYCHSASDVQIRVNVNIGPLLRGYNPRSTTIENIPWRYGKNSIVLKDGTKTSFRVIRCLTSLH